MKTAHWKAEPFTTLGAIPRVRGEQRITRCWKVRGRANDGLGSGTDKWGHELNGWEVRQFSTRRIADCVFENADKSENENLEIKKTRKK